MYAHMHSIQPMLQLHTVSACTVAHVCVRAHGIYQGAYKYAYVYIYICTNWLISSTAISTCCQLQEQS